MKKLLFIAICIMAFGFSMTAYAKEFDPVYYASAYQDVAAAYGSDGAALFKHYTECGQAEGRIPYEGAARGEEVTFTPKVSEPVEAKSNKPADKLAFWLKKVAALPRMYWTDEYCEQTAAIWAPELMKCPIYANAEIISVDTEKTRIYRKGDPGTSWFGPVQNDLAYIYFNLSNGWILCFHDYSSRQLLEIYSYTDGTPEADLGKEKRAFHCSYYPLEKWWENSYKGFLKDCAYYGTSSWYYYFTP
ncbi:MAG: hypothetical protein E7300_12550 [Lachnospiraceae bacterium]|nr:hypothetical protein [Lachnospiraceae bacterium]